MGDSAGGSEGAWGHPKCAGGVLQRAPGLSRSSCPLLEGRAGFHLPGVCFPATPAGRAAGPAAGPAGSRVRLMQRRPGAAAEATGAASRLGFSAVDGFQSILPSCCWEPVPLGKGKHSTYQNLGDRFPALRTRCQDRSKSHVAGRYHEECLRGGRREMRRWQEPGGARRGSLRPRTPSSALWRCSAALGASPTSYCCHRAGRPRQTSDGAGASLCSDPRPHGSAQPLGMLGWRDVLRHCSGPPKTGLGLSCLCFVIPCSVSSSHEKAELMDLSCPASK